MWRSWCRDTRSRSRNTNWIRLGRGSPSADQAFLAALPHRLPTEVLRRFRLLVRPETVLRWHRDLTDARIDPANTRNSTTWSTCLRSHASALLACDFVETFTLSGTRLYVFAVIEHTTRRIRILGATAHPTAAWVTPAAKNLIMDLEDAGTRVRFPIRDRDGKFPALVDAVPSDTGISVVLRVSGSRE